MQFLLAKYCVLGYLGKENPIVSWVSHKDISRIIDMFISNDALSGIFNVSSPKTITADEMTRCFATVMNRPVLYRVPSSLLKLFLGQRAKIFLYPLNVFPERLQEAGYQWVDDDFLTAFYARKEERFQ
jgi:NAD dependent epimerase/dehydratase family enzyme